MGYINLEQWILHPEQLNKETLYELRTLVAKYPYAQTLRLLYLKNLYLLHDSTFGEELRKTALYVADRRILFELIEANQLVLEPDMDNSSPLEAVNDIGMDRTLFLIDSFLSKLPEEEQVSRTLDFDYTTDYSSYLQRNDETKEDNLPKLIGQDLIDDFIATSLTSPTQEPERRGVLKLDSYSEELVEPDDDDEGYFTETLAKIYIKQKRYSKAIEIIKKLSLKYPKKNAYFADQIRFLEKLIINTKSK